MFFKCKDAHNFFRHFLGALTKIIQIYPNRSNGTCSSFALQQWDHFCRHWNADSWSPFGSWYDTGFSMGTLGLLYLSGHCFFFPHDSWSISGIISKKKRKKIRVLLVTAQGCSSSHPPTFGVPYPVYSRDVAGLATYWHSQHPTLPITTISLYHGCSPISAWKDMTLYLCGMTWWRLSCTLSGLSSEWLDWKPRWQKITQGWTAPEVYVASCRRLRHKEKKQSSRDVKGHIQLFQTKKICAGPG